MGMSHGEAMPLEDSQRAKNQTELEVGGGGGRGVESRRLIQPYRLSKHSEETQQIQDDTLFPWSHWSSILVLIDLPVR